MKESGILSSQVSGVYPSHYLIPVLGWICTEYAEMANTKIAALEVAVKEAAEMAVRAKPEIGRAHV